MSVYAETDFVSVQVVNREEVLQESHAHVHVVLVVWSQLITMNDKEALVLASLE